MGVCDVCLARDGDPISSSVILCDECTDTQRGKDLLSLIPLYEAIENSGTRKSLAQLSIHNLLNIYVHHEPNIPLDSAGIGQGELEYGVSMYWALERGSEDRIDYRNVWEGLSGSFLSVGSDEPVPQPRTLKEGDIAEEFAASMVRCRESIGGIASNPQPRKVAKIRYKEFSDELEEIYGFDILDAIDCVDKLQDDPPEQFQRTFERNFDKNQFARIIQKVSAEANTPAAIMGSEVANWIEFDFTDLDGLWIPRADLIDHMENRRAEEFIDALSCPVGDADGYAVNSQSEGVNTVFRCPYDVRPTEKYLFVRYEDDLLWPFPQRSHQVLAERFHYDLQNSSVAGRYRGSQGQYVEELVFEGLNSVFDGSGSFVLNSVYYDHPEEENPPTDPETDVVVKWKDFLLVSECKSRSIIASARVGETVKETLREEINHSSSIGGGYEQALQLIDGIRSGEISELRPKDGPVVEVSSDLHFLPIVIMGGHYEYIAPGGFLPFLNIQWRPPYVCDIYSFDIILQLTDPNELASYIIRRIQLFNRGIPVVKTDELDFFAAFKSGILNPDFLSEVWEFDFADYANDAMSKHPDAEGAMLKFTIGDFLQGTDVQGDFRISEKGKRKQLMVAVTSEGSPRTIRMPFDSELRSKVYPLETR